MKNSFTKLWIIPIFLFSIITACNNSDSETPSRTPYNNQPNSTIKVSNYDGSKKIALVIGNWAYKFKPLNNPQNDARDMAKLLRQLGFQVIYKENLGFEQMEDAVIDFKLQLMDKAKVGLFYFAGHGLEIEKQNYLLATDLRKPETQLIKKKSLEAQWVVNVMEDAGSLVNIVILDACRTFPRPDKSRSTNEEYDFASMNAPKGTIIGFATGTGEKSSDGKKGTNGVYTGHLLKFMRQAGLSIEEVFKKTRQQVAMDTDNQQVPPVYNSLIGDFCFVSCEKPTPPKTTITVVKPKPKPSKFFRDTLNDGSQGPEMVRIPAGSFRMGDIQGGGDSDEKPVHEVSLSAFAMGKYEVTVGEFKRFVKATKYKTDAEKGGSCWVYRGSNSGKNWRNPSFSQNDNHPVTCVSWNDATAYTIWLSEQTGKEYRLPTEAEWEYSARAGTDTKYWWGNNIGTNKANCDGCGSEWDNTKTAPVGSFKENPFGLHDTVGNVWEWTCSEYESKYQGKEMTCKKTCQPFRPAGRFVAQQR